MLIIEKIGILVNEIRPKGRVIFTNGKPSITLPCDAVVGCDCELPQNGEFEYTEMTPYYYFGNVYEIQRVLDVKNLKSKRKYPAVILEQPFKINVIQNEQDKANISLYVVNYAGENESYKERYKENFKEVLYPIWGKLHKAIKRSKLVTSYEIEYIKEHPNFHANKVITDNWDLLEIKLKILFNSCEQEFCERLVYN